jgi:hypothetical protein
VTPPILDRALEHHGMEAWEAADAITAHVSVRGLAFRMPGRAPMAFVGEVSTSEPRTVVHGFGARDRVGTFTAERVWIDEDGTTVSERSNPRSHLPTLKSQVVWDDLDTLYFCGYALWNYLNQPFMLTWPGVELREVGARRVEATFPDGMPVHCRRQVFAFEESGRLAHIEYTADVVGPWARCVHFCFDDEDFGGVRYPTRRRVVPRLAGRALPGPTVVGIRMDGIAASAVAVA